jgi:hypothetical protein
MNEWTREARPRLDAARSDLSDVRNIASQAKQPAKAYRYLIDIDVCLGLYVVALEAITSNGWREGEGEMDRAHTAWRDMQSRYGLAKY